MNSTVRSRGLTAMAAALALSLAGAGFALAQQMSVQGLIKSRSGERITVQTTMGQDLVVTLTGDTKVVGTAGALGIRNEDRTTGDLITGLPVTIEAMQNGAEIDATKVTFKTGDLKTAQQIQAGKSEVEAKAAQTEAENAELRRRLSQAQEYVEKAQTTVLFKTGSATISADAKQELQAIAAKATGIKGYLVSVTGYADKTGNSAANQTLSEKRAMAVIRYLQRCCELQPSRVMSSKALGDVRQVGDTSTSEGLARNRRVVVQVLTNKGLEGLEAQRKPAETEPPSHP
jgi:outer membrane protein OmpA-like peptidoglycan-associated protein